MMKSGFFATIALGGMIAAAPANAQQSDTSGVLEDIVVTAQKRSENLQDVPIAMSAITAEALAETGIRSTGDLALAVGGLNVTRTTAATNFTLRGIGTQGGSTGQDSAIATFIDGVYMPSMAGSTFALNNIARVEVLKGPQGTLYGRNATGGAVNVITRTPQEDFYASGSVGYGNLDTVEGGLYVTGGLMSGVAADFAAYYRDQGEGFGTNRITGTDVNEVDDIALRGKVFVQLGDNTDLTFAADWSRTEGSMAMAYRPVPTAQLLDGSGYSQFVAAGNGFYDSQSEFQPRTEVEIFGGSVKWEHRAGDFTLSNLFAYRGQEGYQRVEVDATALKIIDAPLFDSETQWTNEFQVAYSGERLQAIAGLFFLDSKSEYDPFQIVGLAIGPSGADHLVVESQQRTMSAALFGQVTWEIMSDTNLTLGARVTRDERNLYANQYLLAGAVTPAPLGYATPPTGGMLIQIAPTIDESESFEKPTWRIALDHNFTPDLMVFGSFSRGFKSGVFNLTSPADPAAQPETLDAYEIGFKSTIADRVRFNASLFYYDYQNIQAFQVNGASTTLTNAASAEVTGIDFELRAELGGGFSLDASGSWLDHSYGDFPVATVSFLSQPAGAPGYPGYTAGLGNYVFPSCNDTAHTGQFYCSATGNKLVNTPDYTLNLGLSHEMTLAGGRLNSNVTWAYNDGFYFAVDNRVKQDAYALVNAQVVWTSPNEHYNIRGWVRNLTDEEYLLTVNENGSGDIGTPAAGQTYGVSVGFEF